MRRCGVRALLAGVVLAAGPVAPPAAAAPAGEPAERFGVVPFFKFQDNLTLTPDPAAGVTRVTVGGTGEVFGADWAERGVEFVAFRVHRNPAEADAAANTFPGVLGSRYARVAKVLDGRSLLVDFVFNGGSAGEPREARGVSGYFFLDCAPALRALATAPNRPETVVFRSEETYVCKGLPNIPFRAAEQTNDMRWTASEPGRRVRIKISAEDAYKPAGKPGGALPGGAFFVLDAHDHSVYLRDLDIVGPTYTVPTVQEAWGGVMFAYGRGECERTLEIRNCNTFAEREEAERAGWVLPAGATWVAPNVTGIVGGGGRKGDRGDGVIDLVGYQRFHLINCTWVATCIHSIKNNDGAGNWIVIDGERVDGRGEPVNRVYEAAYVKRNRFPGVRLVFGHAEGAGAKRAVRVVSDDFSWAMLENQYWTGGLAESGGDVGRIEVDGLELYFGNLGDWRRESGDPKAAPAIQTMREAWLFDRIPEAGDRVPAARVETNRFRVWGWGLQTGDVVEAEGVAVTVAARVRRVIEGGAVEGVAGERGGAHFWDLTLDPPPAAERVELTVRTSRSAALLDGAARVADVVYARDLFGHWQYNRAEVNYQYRNIRFNGNFRQTTGTADNRKDDAYQGLWELPVTQEWVNCWAMETDGFEAGRPAREVRSEAFGKRVLQLRNRHPDSRTRDHHVLVDGGRLMAQRLSDDLSPVWIRNRPTLIYGTASYGEPRLCNPVLLDRKGVAVPEAGLSVSLVNGFTLDLSGSVFGTETPTVPVMLNAWGDGTLILDGVRFNAVGTNGVGGGVVTVLANGLPPGPLRLHLRGRGGTGSFDLRGEPEAGSLALAEWTWLRPPYARERLPASAGWKALGLAELVSE